MRCLLLALNHDSWLVSSVPVFVWLVFMFELPPNDTGLMLVDPSGNVEVIRTVPLGMLRYGSL